MKNILWVFVMFTSIVFAQNDFVDSKVSLESIRNLDGVGAGNGAWITSKAEDKTITGSPYLFKTWNGSFDVITKDDVANKLFNLNYNIKTKTIESYISKDSVFQFDSTNIDYVIYNSKKYKNIAGSSDGLIAGLLEEIYKNDKISIYKQFKVTVKTGSLNPLTQEKISSDEYVKSFEYFVFKDGKMTKTKLSKSNILDVLVDKRDLVKNFVSSNNLNYSDEVDLIKILSYYVSL